MRPRILPWVVAAVLLIAASAGGVAVVGATLTTAGAFVQVYLDALARGDGAAAARMPGASSDGAPVTAASALPGIRDARGLSDVDVGGGRHRVAVSWRSGGVAGATTFTVQQDGSTALLFPAWRFAVAPTARVALSIRGDDAVAVGAQSIAVRASRPLLLLVPGAYRVGLRGPLAVSDMRDAVVDRPGQQLALRLVGDPTVAFRSRVAGDVVQALRACARQQALFPAGCPFGKTITDRIASTPTWSITRQPSLTLTPTTSPEVWLAEVSGGSARLEVDIRSLFDGSVTRFSDEVDISGTWRVRTRGDVPVLIALVQGGSP